MRWLHPWLSRHEFEQSHREGQKSLMYCSLWGHKQSDRAEQQEQWYKPDSCRSKISITWTLLEMQNLIWGPKIYLLIWALILINPSMICIHIKVWEALTYEEVYDGDLWVLVYTELWSTTTTSYFTSQKSETLCWCNHLTKKKCMLCYYIAHKSILYHSNDYVCDYVTQPTTPFLDKLSFLVSQDAFVPGSLPGSELLHFSVLCWLLSTHLGSSYTFPESTPALPDFNFPWVGHFTIPTSHPPLLS